MYAIRHNARVLPARFDSVAEAAESAQEDLGLPAAADWAVVFVGANGCWQPVA